MTTAVRLTFLFVSGFLSCTTGDNSTVRLNIQALDTAIRVPVDTVADYTDTIRRFTVDDYPVTIQMLHDTTSSNASYPQKSGNIHSSDKAWFTNDHLNQTLVFEMYTDNHRLAIFHFYNNDIPDAFMERMELHTEDGALAASDQKTKSLQGFVHTATIIDSNYFTTEKGFALGDDKEKALSIYGTPDSISKDGSLEIYTWRYAGDLLYDGHTDLKGKPLAQNSYGHQATMFFKRDKLIAMILHNEIP